MFRASSSHLQEDTVVYTQQMVLSLSMRVPGGLSVHRLSEDWPHVIHLRCVKNSHSDGKKKMYIFMIISREKDNISCQSDRLPQEQWCVCCPCWWPNFSQPYGMFCYKQHIIYSAKYFRENEVILLTAEHHTIFSSFTTKSSLPFHMYSCSYAFKQWRTWNIRS